MSITNVQFAVSTHIMTALAYHHGRDVTSATLAESVNADRTFVRRSVSKLAKAGLVVATRGKNGACRLSRHPAEITLLEIYNASDAPPTFAIHSYEAEASCPISCNIKGGMAEVFECAQALFERSLANRSLADLVNYVREKETSPVLMKNAIRNLGITA